MKNGCLARRTIDQAGKTVALAFKQHETRLRGFFHSVDTKHTPDASIFPLVVKFKLASWTAAEYDDCVPLELDSPVMIRAMERVSFLSSKGDFRVDCTCIKQWLPQTLPLAETKETKETKGSCRYEIEIHALRQGAGVAMPALASAALDDKAALDLFRQELPRIEGEFDSTKFVERWLYKCFSLVLNIVPEHVTCRIARRS